MISNTGDVARNGAEIGLTNAAAEFAAFDALPSDLRRALDQAPVKIMAVSAFELTVTQGADAARRGLSALIEQVCPGYQPLPKPRRRRRPYR